MIESNSRLRKSRLVCALNLPLGDVIERIWTRIRICSPCRLLRHGRLLLAQHRGQKLTVRIPRTGCLMELDPSHSMTRAWYVRADYESKLITGLRRYLRPGMICLDVGANAGIFSLFMAKRVGNRGKVYAFEPTSETFQRLQKNINLNAMCNIIAENVAVAEKAGEIDFYVGSTEFSVYNSITVVVHPSARKGRFTRVLVPAITLDDYCGNHNIDRVDCVKIDVEGAEMQVLKGMNRVLKDNPQIVLLIEFFSVTATASGSSVMNMAEWLKSFGFQLFIISSRGCLQPLRGDIPQNGEMVWAARTPDYTISSNGYKINQGKGDIKCETLFTPR